jgi:diadenosine tetraphosphate (Ap4A) HIT family hydrolase
LTRRHLLLVSLAASLARADIVTCACDHTRPETLEARPCSLCREAEKQPADTHIFFLRDVNPSKPNRWLALPRTHARSFDRLPAELRSELLRAAMDKAKALFGDGWAIAYNAPEVQTQCHVHLHLGKWMPAVENSQFVSVQRIEEVPVPPKGEGFWVHPAGNALHVHTGDQITETVLVR